MSEQDPGEGADRSLFRPMLFLAAGTLFACGVLGYALGGRPQAREVLESLAAALGPLQELGAVELMAVIFLNNAVKAGGVILLGSFLGIPPVLFLITNGLIVGVAVYQAAAERGLAFVVVGLAPHGLVELPALLVATALGLEMGVEVWRWLRRRPSRIRRRLGRAMRTYLFYVAPALAAATVIEVTVTPLLLKGL